MTHNSKIVIAVLGLGEGEGLLKEQTQTKHFSVLAQRCLLAAMEPWNDQLTKQERSRNRHTECAVYTHQKEADFKYSSTLPQIFPDIIHCHVR